MEYVVSTEKSDGSQIWTYSNGTVIWLDLNKAYHRADGPAIVCKNGYEVWYVHGIRHRWEGPAVKQKGGGYEWWVRGIKLTSDEKKFWERVLSRFHRR